MKYYDVNSTVLTKIGYDEENNRLKVQFNDLSKWYASFDEETGGLEIKFSDVGQRYSYFNVEKDVFNKFLSSSSKGKFFSNYIKTSYPYKRDY